MTTGRGSRRGVALAGHRRTIVAGTCLLLAAGAWTAWTFRPHFEATGSVLVVANPVYAAASPAAVAPRALTADRTLSLPSGVAVAVEPGPSGVVRITVTAPDGVTAQAVANRVLDIGLPAALRAQVADGLRLRRAVTGTPKVSAADVDATLAAYRLRVVTVTRATGTTPSGADAVQAVAVAQVGGLPATTPDPQVVTRLLAASLDPAAVDRALAGRRAGAVVTSPGGPALTVSAQAGSQDLAGRVAQDVLGSAQGPLVRLLRGSGLPDDTLVLQPYLTPAAVAVRPVPPWWLTGLVGLVALALGAAVLLDRRDRGDRGERAGERAGERRTARTAPFAARARRPVTAGPVAAGPGAGGPVAAGPSAAPAGAAVVAPVPAPVGTPWRPWDWSPVRLAEYGDLPPVAAASAGPGWGDPRPMPPAPLHAAAVGQPADQEPAGYEQVPHPAAFDGAGFAEPSAGSSAGSSADPAGEPFQAVGPEPDAVPPVSVVDLRSRIFGADGMADDATGDATGDAPDAATGAAPWDAGGGPGGPSPARPALGPDGRPVARHGHGRTPDDIPAPPVVPDRKSPARATGRPAAAPGSPAAPVAPGASLRSGSGGPVAQPFAQSPAGQSSVGQQPSAEQSVGQQSVGQQPFRQRSVGQQPVMPPPMPGRVPASGDPASFAPPLHSVLVEPAVPQVVRRDAPAGQSDEQSRAQPDGQSDGQPDVHPLAALDRSGPAASGLAASGLAASDLAASDLAASGPSVVPAQPSGRPARTVTPFVPPTVRPTRRTDVPVPASAWTPPAGAVSAAGPLPAGGPLPPGGTVPAGGTVPTGPVPGDVLADDPRSTATYGWQPPDATVPPSVLPVLPPRLPGRPAAPSATVLPGRPGVPGSTAGGPVPVPLPAAPADERADEPAAHDGYVDGHDDGHDDDGAGPDRAWSDILGTGTAQRRPGRPPRFRGRR